MRVLVVEDFPDARELVASILISEGYEVISAEDGQEGVRLAREHRPAVIVMDLFMPVMDGVEATRQIRATPELAHSRVIAYTAKPSGIDRALFDAVCKKPCPPDELISIVAQLAAGQAVQAQSRKPWHAN
jgi:CheY-like chemotaxis protein